MFRYAAPLACLALIGCQTTTEPERAAMRAEASASTAATLEAQIRPAFAACVPFAQGGSVDTAALARAGFTGPETSLGRQIYRAGPSIYVAVNENRGSCRVAWIGAPRGARIATTLNGVMQSAGYSRGGGSGDRVAYSGGNGTIEASSTFVSSYGATQIDTTLFRP